MYESTRRAITIPGIILYRVPVGTSNLLSITSYMSRRTYGALTGSPCGIIFPDSAERVSSTVGTCTGDRTVRARQFVQVDFGLRVTFEILRIEN